MPPTPTRQLIDLDTGGRLDEIVEDGRQGGDSWQQISVRLLREFDVEASPESLRRWYGGVADAEQSS